jgi:hypothetical protein
VEHVVFFPAPDGSPAFRRVASLDDAVRLVEHLRNVEGVSSVSVHALTEVPLAFRAYYRVEVPGEAVVDGRQVETPVVEVPAQPAPDVASEAAPASDAAEVEVPPLALVEDVPAAEPVRLSPNGSGSAAPTSLGFFA